MGHRRIARAFRRLFNDLHNAENTTLHRNGRIAARGLLQGNVRVVKISLAAIFKVCREMA
jgi:hypothetical protein